MKEQRFWFLAGASKPYGFPTGEELLREIVDIKHHGPTPLETSLRDCGFLPKDIQHFVDELNRSGRKSVDAFLEHRTEFEKVGKAAMIAALIPKEDPSTLFDRSNQEHWYQYLFQQMGSSFEEFCKSKLSIITFNYDRSPEYFLLNAIRSSFKKKDYQCVDALTKMPIIHLHGQLGSLLVEYSDHNYRRFEQKITPDIVERCIPEIKIIHEVNVENDRQFMLARKKLLDAERVCFLGFGYDKTNIERLFGDLGATFFSTREIYGTTVGFTQEEVKRRIWDQLTAKFHGGNSSFNNLDLLRETGILF